MKKDNVLTLKVPASKSTLREVLTNILEDEEFDDESVVASGIMIVSTDKGLKLIPLASKTYVEYLGLLAITNQVIVDLMYEDEYI